MLLLERRKSAHGVYLISAARGIAESIDENVKHDLREIGNRKMRRWVDDNWLEHPSNTKEKSD